MSKLSYEEIIKRAKINADCGEHLSPEEVTELVLAFEAQVKQLAEANQQLRDENLKSTSALYDVVAENVALKSAHPQPSGPEMMKAIEAYELHQDDIPETGMLNAFFILRDSITLNTGVTDSVIAKIRAESMADGAFGALKLMGGFTSDECGDSVYLTVKGYAEQLSNSVHNPGAFLASLRAEGVEMLVNGLLTESFRMKAAGALADFDGITEDGLKQIVWSGQPPEPEGCVWDVEYMTRAWVVMKVIKEFAAQLRSQSEQVKGVQS